MSDYFSNYAKREKLIADKWLSSLVFQTRNEGFEIFYDIEKDNTPYHDLKVVLTINTGNINYPVNFTIEVKEEENYWFSRTGNIGLDLISAFNFVSSEVKTYFKNIKRGWVSPDEIQNFFSNIRIGKEGKLYTCDADIQLFFCGSERDKDTPILMKAYFNRCLQNNINYFLSRYPIRINNKKDYASSTDTWESAVILANPYTDEALNLCEIKKGSELIGFLREKFGLNF